MKVELLCPTCGQPSKYGMDEMQITSGQAYMVCPKCNTGFYCNIEAIKQILRTTREFEFSVTEALFSITILIIIIMLLLMMAL